MKKSLSKQKNDTKTNLLTWFEETNKSGFLSVSLATFKTERENLDRVQKLSLKELVKESNDFKPDPLLAETTTFTGLLFKSGDPKKIKLLVSKGKTTHKLLELELKDIVHHEVLSGDSQKNTLIRIYVKDQAIVESHSGGSITDNGTNMLETSQNLFLEPHSYQQESRKFQVMSNALRAAHDAAMNSISNAR